MRITVLPLLVALSALPSCSPVVKVYDPRVECHSGYCATDEVSPRFSWKIKSPISGTVQESYRILVASDPNLLKVGEADVWDSGKMVSDSTLYLAYKGRELQSGERLWWKVFIRTNKGKARSSPMYWDMGLLNETNWTALWIGGSHPTDNLVGCTRVNARYLRKEFKLNKKPQKALLNVCGLGLCETFINGERVAAGQVLTPTVSDYDKTVYYNVFDVTKLLTKGSNALGVTLGNGRYVTMRENLGQKLDVGYTRPFGLPCLRLQLEISYPDGSHETIVSDGSWKISMEGPIRCNNEYDGESYDARKEMPGWSKSDFNDEDWKNADIVAGPKGKLKVQPNPNIAIQETMRPLSVSIAPNSTANDTKYIVDMGQNMSGWVQIKAGGLPCGDTLTLRFAEVLSPDGSLYRENLGNAEATDRYISSGPGTFSWHPSFTIHGFRYVEISGLSYPPKLSDIEGQVIHDDLPLSGNFECSDQIMNAVYHNAIWSIKGNYRGMPIDCPQRSERMGWLGDRTTVCRGEAYAFCNQLLYTKWLQDIEDSQRESGVISDVSPNFWRAYNDGVTWPATFITVADMLYKQYGDSRPIQKHYPAMKRWLIHTKESYTGEDGTIWKNSYGDWCQVPESLDIKITKDTSIVTDGSLLSTAFFVYVCRLMEYFCELAAHPEDKPYYESLSKDFIKAFNEKFYHEEGYYANNTVTANILPLCIGIAPQGSQEKIVRHIVDKTENDYGGHVSSGVVGMQFLMRGLSDHGAADLALKLASNDSYPGWGYMVRQGATTIWELWNNDKVQPKRLSDNHVMLLGDLMLWEYTHVGGISPMEASFKTIELRPWPSYTSTFENLQDCPGLNWANCTYNSVHGVIRSDWKIRGNNFLWKVEIPANTSAVVHIPGQIDTQKVFALGGIALENDSFLFPSGKYKIHSRLSDPNLPSNL